MFVKASLFWGNIGKWEELHFIEKDGEGMPFLEHGAFEGVITHMGKPKLKINIIGEGHFYPEEAYTTKEEATEAMIVMINQMITKGENEINMLKRRKDLTDKSLKKN